MPKPTPQTNHSIKRLKQQRPPLPIITATPEEISQHSQYIKSMQEKGEYVDRLIRSKRHSIYNSPDYNDYQQ